MIAMPIVRRATPKHVAGELTPAQNERLRIAMLAYMHEECSGSKTELAKRLARSQPSITDFLNRKGGAAFKTAVSFARLIRKDVTAVIGQEEPMDGEAMVVARPQDVISAARNETIDRVGRLGSYHHDDIENAQMLRGRSGTAGLTDEQARDILDAMRMARRALHVPARSVAPTTDNDFNAGPPKTKLNIRKR